MRSFGARRVAQMIVRAGIWDRLRAIKRTNPFAFWLFVAVSTAFLLYGQASTAADCPVIEQTPWPETQTNNAALNLSTMSGPVTSCSSTACSNWKNANIDGKPATAANIATAITTAASAIDASYSGPETFAYTTDFITSTTPDSVRIGIIATNRSRAIYIRVSVLEPATPCTPPPSGVDCSINAGKTTIMENVISKVGGYACSDGCKVFVNSQVVETGGPLVGTWVTIGEYRDEECTGDDGMTVGEPQDPDDLNEYCATTEGGQTFCVPKDKRNCGYYNDEWICPGAIPADNCVQTESGKRFCADGAPTPPVPDTGTPGVPATPEDRIKTAKTPDAATPAGQNTEPAVQQITNVYGAGQVAGSSRDGTVGGTGTGSGGTGTGTGSGGAVVKPPGEPGDEELEGDGDGGGTFSGPELSMDTPSFGVATAAFQESIAEGPLGQSLVGQSFSVAGAACPAPTIAGFGGSWDLDFHCELFESYRALFSALFLFGWMVLAARVFLSA
jgi:hypothetical protein